MQWSYSNTDFARYNRTGKETLVTHAQSASGMSTQELRTIIANRETELANAVVHARADASLKSA